MLKRLNLNMSFLRKNATDKHYEDYNHWGVLLILRVFSLFFEELLKGGHHIFY